MACRVIVLEDNDILHLARGSYSIYNLQRDDPSAKMASVSRALNRLDMEVCPDLMHVYCNHASPCLQSNFPLLQPQSLPRPLSG